MSAAVRTDHDVRRLDVHDDADAAAVYAVARACLDHERPWNEQDGPEGTVAEWRYDSPAERLEVVGVRVGDALAGVAFLWFPLLDNVEKLYTQVYVTPALRRRGVGSALVDEVVRRAARTGRRDILVDALVPPGSSGDHPAERFARHTGFTLASTDNIRLLALPVPQERLDALAETARPHWSPAYRVETYADGLPEHLVAGYCRVSNLLGVDAPTGEVEFEAESMTPEHYRSHLALERSQGRRRLTTVAVEASDQGGGAVVAYTDLVLPAGAPEHVWQWGTLVDREHRGHRLGTAVKVENLRRLQRDHPERSFVGTGNDDTNAWMVSINEALGFELVEHMRIYHRVLGG